MAAFTLLLSLLSVWTHTAQAAGPDPATTCEVAKLRAVGKKATCLATEEAKAVLGKLSNPAKCEQAFTRAFTKAEEAATEAGGVCTVTGDAEAIEQRIDVLLIGTAQLLAGTGRFRDNGDGTVTDADTGLMWEQKDDSGGLHDKDLTYGLDWMTTTWISDVNTEGGTGFAEYNDWRAPTIQELQSILDYSRFSPAAIDPVFGPTVPSDYWSSTSRAGYPSQAWVVYFGNGNVGAHSKSDALYVRAVRDSF